MDRSPRLTAPPLLLCALLSCVPGCGGSPDEQKKEPALLEVALHEPAAEGPTNALFEPPRLGHREVLAQLRSVATESRLRGLLLHIGFFGSAWARAEDIKRALGSIRAADKPVHCHIRNADNLGYAIAASSCDEITMTPGGMLNLVGLRAQGLYAREALAGLGLTAELLHVGKYKGAADALTLDAMPDTARETMEDMLADLESIFVAALRERPTLAKAEVQALFDAGPYTADRARGAGLVERVAYDDEARQRAREAAGTGEVERAPRRPEREEAGLGAILRALAGDKASDVEGEHLALAYLEGTIVSGGPESRSGAEAHSFVRKMRAWADDPDVRAVVLRIHSPGGSALASDLMWHALRRVAKRKPVVASIGDMAASGGYYVASAATEIHAEAGSLVGSIGVVGGKIVAEDLAGRVGLHSEIIRRGQNAAWDSALHRFTPSERAAVEQLLQRTYRIFVSRVSAGRNMPPGDVEMVAQGRLMSGTRGKKGGLIDELGGLQGAIARARALGELPEDAPLEVWPGREAMLDQLAAAMGAAPEEEASAAAVARAIGVATGGPLLPLSRLSPWGSEAALRLLLSPSAGPAALAPFGLDVR